MVSTLITMLAVNVDKRFNYLDGTAMTRGQHGQFLPAVKAKIGEGEELLPVYVNEFKTKAELDSLEESFMRHAKDLFEDIRRRRGWNEVAGRTVQGS